MPIYDIFASKEPESFEEVAPELPVSERTRDRFFSSMTTRILFVLLLIGDVAWTLWSLLKLSLLVPLFFLTFGKSVRVKEMLRKTWISLKRAGVCGISLVVALFSPALGIMVACTYFLMYDKAGIHEVVPRSLQDQFQEFLKESK